MLDQNTPENAGGFRAKLDRILELIVGSSFGAAILYSIFWGAFQSLAIGHFSLNDGRFVAVSCTSVVSPVIPKSLGIKSDEEGDSTAAADTGDAIEIWFASAKHRSLLQMCRLDFEFTGMNITNYTFGSDRRTNPHHAKYLSVLGIEKNPKLPGPYIYLHFESTFGTSSHTYQLNFEYKKNETGSTVGLPADQETFVATSSLGLTPWECIATVFVGGGFKIVDFSDFAFLKSTVPNIASP